MLLSIIRSVVVFNMFVDMLVFNNLMYAAKYRKFMLKFRGLKGRRFGSYIFTRFHSTKMYKSYKD